MPNNLSAWLDLSIQLFVLLLMIGIIAHYNIYIALTALVLWICLSLFARERCHVRTKKFERYVRSVIKNLNVMLNYAVEDLPQYIFIIDEEGRIQWMNVRMKDYVGENAHQGMDVRDVWTELIVDPIWGMEGEYVFKHEKSYFKTHYRPVPIAAGQPPLMAFYVEDHTEFEAIRTELRESRMAFVYIQIDNYDEVMQRQSEAERTALLLSVNQQLGDWTQQLGGFMRRVSEDLYIVLFDRKALDVAIKEKFDILDHVRQIQNTNRLPVTLSIGISLAENRTMAEVGDQAQAELDLALGRGGDQVAACIDGKTQFFGGRAKAVEKHTRVKARVVAHALRELMEGADEVYVMGHHNEDYDCFGAAIGIAKMATFLEKPVHIVLSDMHDGIDKVETLVREKEGYKELMVHADEAEELMATNPLLVIVDTHIPYLVADPDLLSRIHRVVVIDHHRRSENFIENPILVYIEPASSSASELVTELLMYFDESITLSRIDATALYSGIIVDTKNFAVQTGVRTFDAASYLRRSGADPVMVRHLFRTDYDTTVLLAKAKARSEYYPGGLIVSTCPKVVPNGQIIAAQAADSLLRVEDVRMTIVVFQLTSSTVGISARSTGELNVQVIMETFGGGGHQNVAGAQVKGGDLEDIKQKAIDIAEKYIEEADKDESDTAAGH